MPVALEGTHRIMSKGAADTGKTMHDRIMRSMRKIHVSVGEPLYPTSEGKEKDRVIDLRDRTREAIVTMHGNLFAEAERLWTNETTSR